MTALDTANVPRNFLNGFVDPAKLNVISPLTKHITEVRFIPEVHPDGSILPASLGMTPTGAPDISNLCLHQAVIAAGEKARFTGITAPSDVEVTDVDNVFSGTWIRYRGRLKKPQEIPAEQLPRLMHMMQANEKGQSIIARPCVMAFMQAIVLIENDNVLARPAIKQVVVMRPAAVMALRQLLAKLFAEGRDPFSPEQGVGIRFVGVPPDKSAGRTVWTFQCEVSREIPMKPEMCRKLWVPWSQGLKRYTQEELYHQAANVYGADIMGGAFPDLEKLYGAPKQEAAPAASAAVKAAPARPAATPAPVMQLDISDDELEAPPAAIGEQAPAPAAEPAAAPIPAQAVSKPAPAAQQPQVQKVATPPPAKAEVVTPTPGSLVDTSAEELERQMMELLGGSDEG